jgi:hypothetical protein
MCGSKDRELSFLEKEWIHTRICLISILNRSLASSMYPIVYGLNRFPYKHPNALKKQDCNLSSSIFLCSILNTFNDSITVNLRLWNTGEWAKQDFSLASYRMAVG